MTPRRRPKAGWAAGARLGPTLGVAAIPAAWYDLVMRIGLLTGGGDVPGLNPCIKAVVNRVSHDGHEVVGLRRGWAGLLKHDLDDPASAAEWFQPLTPSIVRTIDRTGGTFLHTSRTNPSRVRAGEVPAHLAARASGDGPFDFTDDALRVVEALGIDGLVLLAVMIRCPMHGECIMKACPWSRSRRPWTTTSTGSTTDRVFDGDTRGVRFTITFARLPVLMNGSGSSSCSVGTPVRHRYHRVPRGG